MKILLLTLSLGACVSAQAQNNKEQNRQKHWERVISIYHDDYRGVTCWVLEDGAVIGGGNSALSCLPDREIGK